MKKRNRLLMLLVLILTVVVAMTALYACVDPNAGDGDKDDTVIESKDMLLSNGTFYNATSSTSEKRYVKDTLQNWTKTSGAIGYSSALMGAVDIGKLKENSSLIWDDQGFRDAVGDGIGFAPNTKNEINDKGESVREDDYAAVIASTNNEASVYYASSSSKIEKNKYYKLSIDLWTYIDRQRDQSGEGAYLFVTDGVYAQWDAIDTHGLWETRTLYIEGNNFEDRSFSVQLWLGHGPAKIGTAQNDRLTKGVAFFDNVRLESISAEQYEEADVAADVNLVDDQEVKKTSLVFPDTEFDYNRAISSSSTASSTTKAYYSARVGAPYNYTQVVGQTDLTSDKPFVSSAGNSAPYGIFDLAKLYQKEADGTFTDTFSKINTTEFAAPARSDFFNGDGVFDNNARAAADAGYAPNDSRALLIYNNRASGIGYKSDKKLLIQTGYYYRVSVWTYVYKALTLPNKILNEDGTAVELTLEQFNENRNAVDTYNANHPEAHVKLTGASLRDAEELVQSTAVTDWNSAPVEVKSTETASGKYTMTVVFSGDMGEASGNDAFGAKEGYWDEVVFYVQGNALSDRRVNVEFWLGEGTVNDVGTLVQGGAIFDSLKIRSATEKADLDGGDAADFRELSPFSFEDMNDYADLTNGGLNDKITEIVKNKEAAGGADNRSENLSLQFADGVNSADSALRGYVVGAKANKNNDALAGLDPDDFKEWKVQKDNADAYFNTLLLRNLDYTASTLTVNPTAAIRQNNYYRLSMWVKTVGLDKDQGVTINLIQRNTESDYKTPNVLSSFTGVNTEKNDAGWTEYVFYISGNYVVGKDASGAPLEENNVTVQFVMGTGDSYNTATHVKGSLIVGALNVQGSITYSEYNSASTGDTLKKYAYSSNVSTDNTVSGGRFNTVDYDGTIKAYNDKNLNKSESDKLSAYDDQTGNLVGVGKPSSTTWSLSSPVSNQVAAPTSLSINSEKITWTGNADAAKYEIYYKDDKVAEVSAQEDDTEYRMEWARPFTSTGTFYIRAVPKDKGAKLISNKNSITTSTAGDKVTVDFATWYKDNQDSIPTEEKNYETNFGIVDYNHIDQKNIDHLKSNGNSAITSDTFKNLYSADETLYPKKNPNDTRYYFGAADMLSHLYDNVLMLSSQYKTRGGYTMYSSTSLSAESYYEISVWVKTLGEATASFTIDNSTNTFYNTSDSGYIGFNNVKTNGEWVQLKFYARTGLSSATMKLKLFMGDPYVENYKDGEGLCAGTVFYDDISLQKLDDKEAYEKLTEGKSDYKGDGEFFKNSALDAASNVYTDLDYELNAYAYKTLEFSIDSFDVTTDSTTTATGSKPDDYSQTILGENTSVSNAHEAKVAYGVYNVNDLDDEKHAYLYENFMENGEIPAWFGINDITALKAYMRGFGDNVLVMANFIDNGMYYKSTNKSIKASSYYQISFYAKLKAPEGKSAEMRFYHGDDTAKYEAIKVSGMGDEAYGFKKYTLYVYNETTSAISSNYITFNLGAKDETDKDNVKTDYIQGMLIVDNVAITEVTAEEYNLARTEANYDEWSEDQQQTSNTPVNFTHFSPKSVSDGDGDTTNTESGWDSATWLIFSTSIIGLMIVVAVAVVLIKNFKKKHIKAKAPEVESNVKVEGYVAEKKEQKKDADRREFDD